VFSIRRGKNMSRGPAFIKVSDEEMERIKSALRAAVREGQLRFRRRLQAIWFSLEGWSVARIARTFKVSESNVWQWRRIYKQKGLAGLKGKYRSKKL